MKKIAVVFAMILLSSFTIHAENEPAQAPAESSSSTPQQFEGFDLTGYSQDGTKTWDLKGDNADVLGDKITLTNVNANAYGDEKMNVTAKTGTINKASGKMHLEKDVVITTETGAKMVTDSLDWERDKDLVSNDDPVIITKDTMTATGKGMTGHPNLREAQLNEDVTVKIKTETQDAQSSGTITITCDGPMEIEYEKQKAVFNKNVVAIDGDRRLAADIIEVFFDAQTKQIKEMICIGNVAIKQGDNTSYSQRAVYNAAEKRLVLTGSPKLILYTEEDGGLSFGEMKSSSSDSNKDSKEAKPKAPTGTVHKE